MSYPRDLDEFAEKELVAELERRERLRRRGLCDYCGSPAGVLFPNGRTCSHPERHDDPRATR